MKHKTYQSTENNVRRTLRVEPNIARMEMELFQDGEWDTQTTITYTPEEVKRWGYPSLEEFVQEKIRTRGMEEVI